MNSKKFTADQAKTITGLLNTIGAEALTAFSDAIDDMMFASNDETRAEAYVEARKQLGALRTLHARAGVAWSDPEGQWNDEAAAEARQ